MYYQNIQENLRIGVTTESDEKFYVLINPFDTIDELNKKITKTYQINYKTKKIIEKSYLNDFLLPKESIVSELINNGDHLFCRFSATLNKNSANELAKQKETSLLPKLQKGNTIEINEKINTMNKKEKKNVPNSLKESKNNQNEERKNIVEQTNSKEINEEKTNKRKSPKVLDGEDDIVKKKIKKEPKEEKIDISSKIFEDISFFEKLKNEAVVGDIPKIFEVKQEKKSPDNANTVNKNIGQTIDKNIKETPIERKLAKKTYEEDKKPTKNMEILEKKNESKETAKSEPKKKRLISKKQSSSIQNQKSADKKEKNEPLFTNTVILTEKEVNISSSTTCNKLLENLTKSNYKNNLIDSVENKNNTQNEKEIILKETQPDPLLIKKTIEKIMVENKNTRVSTEKKKKPSPDEKNKINNNLLIKNAKQPEIKENAVKKQQPATRKKRENTPNPEKKQTSRVIDLANSPKEEKKLSNGNDEDKFLKFIQDLELHFQGKLDDVVFMSSQHEEKKAEKCKEKVIMLNDFETKEEDNAEAKKKIK